MVEPTLALFFETDTQSSQHNQCYKLGNSTRFALMTPRLFFLPTTMTSAPLCTLSTSARGTSSPVRKRTAASSSMRIARGFVSPVRCFTIWPAMTYLCLFPGAITTPVIVSFYPSSRSMVISSSEDSRRTCSCCLLCRSEGAFVVLECFPVCPAQIILELNRTPIKLQVNRGRHRNQEMRTLKVPGAVAIRPAAEQE